MKILQLCKKFPYPLKDGESIACTYLARAFAELGHEVTLLSMNTSKHFVDTSTLPADFDHYAAMHAVYIDNHIRPLPALLNLFTDRSYHVERFDQPAFAERLAAVLAAQSFDVIQLESIYLAPYLPVIRRHAPRALVVLRAHNVEFEIWERVAEGSHPLKRWYLERITPRLKRYEVGHLNHFDLVVGIAARDVEHFQRLGLQRPAVVAPIGLDARAYRPDPSSFARPLSLSFIGSLDWMPNIDGLRWFLQRVWQPLLAPAFPELSFHIAGRNTPAWLLDLRLPGVHVHGEVPDAAEFINHHSVMIVPLLSGGGMRAKILEGFALGKVVLSTALGMEGIPARPGQEALLAETPEDFLAAIRWCYAHGEPLAAMGRRARVFCETHFDNVGVARQLLQTYSTMTSGLQVEAP